MNWTVNTSPSGIEHKLILPLGHNELQVRIARNEKDRWCIFVGDTFMCLVPDKLNTTRKRKRLALELVLKRADQWTEMAKVVRSKYDELSK